MVKKSNGSKHRAEKSASQFDKTVKNKIKKTLRHKNKHPNDHLTR